MPLSAAKRAASKRGSCSTGLGGPTISACFLALLMRGSSRQTPDRCAADLLEGANAPPTGPGHGMQGALIGGSTDLFVIIQVGAVDAFGTQLIDVDTSY
ncbi:hypothetical protein AHML_12765 [Aeromonas hydrophila ML09-119]|nr:hypothetical protein AHML_12765 [Aeromonas hydrophila ML09-119]